MRVLMLGWDFSPRLSGGIGSACQGLANALARANEPTEVLFVLPRLRGDEEPEKVRLLSGTEESPAAPLPRAVESSPEPIAASERAHAAREPKPGPPPALPS